MHLPAAEQLHLCIPVNFMEKRYEVCDVFVNSNITAPLKEMEIYIGDNTYTLHIKIDDT